MVRRPHRRAIAAGIAAVWGVAAGGAATAAGPELPLGPRDGALHREPAPALNARGDGLAAWVRAPAGAPSAGVVQAASRRGPRGAWSGARPLSGPGASGPRAALGSRGEALVVWRRGERLEVATRSGEGRWSAAVAADGVGDLRALEVALDPDGGRAQVLWAESREGGSWRVRYAVRAAAGEGFAAPLAPLDLPGPAAPSLSVEPRRAGALVAWSDGEGEDARVRAAAPASSRWAAADVAEDGAVAVGAALSPRGDALVSWATGLPGGSRVVAVRDRPAGRPFRPPADVGLGIGPRAAIGARGDALAVWQVLRPDGRRGVEGVSRARFAGRWVPSTLVPIGCACDLALGRPLAGARGHTAATLYRDTGFGPGRGLLGVLRAGAERWSVRDLGPADVLTPPAAAMNGRGAVLALTAFAGGRRPIRAVAHDGLGALALRATPAVRPGAPVAVRFALPAAAPVRLRLWRAGRQLAEVRRRGRAGAGVVRLRAPRRPGRYRITVEARALWQGTSLRVVPAR